MRYSFPVVLFLLIGQLQAFETPGLPSKEEQEATQETIGFSNRVLSEAVRARSGVLAESMGLNQHFMPSMFQALPMEMYEALRRLPSDPAFSQACEAAFQRKKREGKYDKSLGELVESANTYREFLRNALERHPFGAGYLSLTLILQGDKADIPFIIENMREQQDSIENAVFFIMQWGSTGSYLHRMGILDLDVLKASAEPLPVLRNALVPEAAIDWAGALTAWWAENGDDFSYAHNGRPGAVPILFATYFFGMGVKDFEPASETDGAFFVLTGGRDPTVELLFWDFEKLTLSRNIIHGGSDGGRGALRAPNGFYDPITEGVRYGGMAWDAKTQSLRVAFGTGVYDVTRKDDGSFGVGKVDAPIGETGELLPFVEETSYQGGKLWVEDGDVYWQSIPNGEKQAVYTFGKVKGIYLDRDLRGIVVREGEIYWWLPVPIRSNDKLPFTVVNPRE